MNGEVPYPGDNANAQKKSNKKKQ